MRDRKEILRLYHQALEKGAFFFLKKKKTPPCSPPFTLGDCEYLMTTSGNNASDFVFSLKSGRYYFLKHTKYLSSSGRGIFMSYMDFPSSAETGDGRLASTPEEERSNQDTPDRGRGGI